MASGAEQYDIAVIGGGILGASSALALTEAAPGLSLVLLEKENALARHQTGNNSGVIHSGLYYRPDSLKARNCVEGREALYAFCRENDIPHERCGKVVVAVTEKEIPTLDELERRGKANGLVGIERLDSRQIREREPRVEGIEGLWVPETGIVNFARVTEVMAERAAKKGGRIRTGREVKGIGRDGALLRLHTPRGEIRCRALLNCCGLQCDRVARLSGIDPGLRIVPFRGEYYHLVESRRHLVRNLIYPVPDPALPFLGVHFTRMIDGRVEAGPNAVLALRREGYRRHSFSLRDTFETLAYSGFRRMVRGYARTGLQEYHRSFSKAAFVRELRHLIPSLQPEDLVRGGAGVRAQAVDPDGTLVDDFRLVTGERMIHVLNAPSPAATASLSLGRTLARLALESFELD